MLYILEDCAKSKYNIGHTKIYFWDYRTYRYDKHENELLIFIGGKK